VSFVSACFALLMTLVGLHLLVSPKAEIVDDIVFGRSELVQFGAAMSTGFFMWNLCVDKERSVSQVHHVVALANSVLVTYPFVHRLTCVIFLWEASTIPLATFNILRALGLTHKPLYGHSRVLFAVVFMVVRLVIGIPMTMETARGLWAYQKSLTLSVPSSCLRMLPTCWMLLSMLVATTINTYWAFRVLRSILALTGDAKEGRASNKGKVAD